ncbi:MAG: hypothetical protein LBT83_09670, partial [Tannerella sp.]|nr:hypothetical protein [Tannerella sp.]
MYMQRYADFGKYTTRPLQKSFEALMRGLDLTFRPPIAMNTQGSSAQRSFYNLSPTGENLSERFSYFQPGGTSRCFKKRFSVRRNSPTSSKIIFQPGGTLRRVQKSFFKPAELPDEFK